ncbi:MAG: hypothetical protein E7559_03025 [Ruminococcaceae bacterium]|nr:hypothetical protein [Oscillospiraceae bacterium]
MSEIFTSVMGMSLAGGIAVLPVLLIRTLLRPSRRICCIMWLLVGLRLVLPFSFADALGLSLPQTAVTDRANAVYELVIPDAQTDTAPAVVNSAPSSDTTEALSPVSIGATDSLPAVSADRLMTMLWLTGAAAVAVCVAAAYIKLRMRLRTAVRMDADVYRSEHIPAPFVFGLVRPRIYIPYSVADGDIPFVLKHERNHIRNCDHISKAAALAVLALHWFNPLVWVAYVFFCRDVETACDEKVIAHMTLPDRRLYSAALLSCSTGRRISVCPVAFGEVGVKERIKHIMKYTKPAFTRNLFAAILCVALVLCIFALPVGCAKEPAVYEPVDTEAADYEGTDRIVNEDGSITMLFMPQSNFSSDSIQTFRYSGEGYTINVTADSGFITTPDENGRIIYVTSENLPDEVDNNSGAYITVTDNEGYLNYDLYGMSVSVYSHEDIVWIPSELNFGTEKETISSKINFTIKDGDSLEDTVTITIVSDDTAVTPEGMKALTISVDKNHILRVNNDDPSRPITIEHHPQH